MDECVLTCKSTFGGVYTYTCSFSKWEKMKWYSGDKWDCELHFQEFWVFFMGETVRGDVRTYRTTEIMPRA